MESDCAFLKDPLIVNDIFLKSPSRIGALGMVLNLPPQDLLPFSADE